MVSRFWPVAMAAALFACAGAARAQSTPPSPSPATTPTSAAPAGEPVAQPRSGRNRFARETAPEAGGRTAPRSRRGKVAALPPARPESVAGIPAPETSPVRSLFSAFDNPAPPSNGSEFATNPLQTLFGAVSPQARGERLPPVATRGQIDALIAHHAKLNGVPEALVHRIVVRESKYNPRAVGRGGAMGLMQIKTATARGVGYGGGPSGLLDAETNITYAVKYLAGAWRVSGGSHDRAVSHYAGGYYYAAKRMNGGRAGGRGRESGTVAQAPAPERPASFFSLFSTADASR